MQPMDDDTEVERLRGWQQVLYSTELYDEYQN